MRTETQTTGGLRRLDTAPVAALGFGIVLASTLAIIERRWPQLREEHTWLEVVAGVIGTVTPVAVAAYEDTAAGLAPTWKEYQAALVLAFIGSGAPIVLWQFAELPERQAVRHEQAA